MTILPGPYELLDLRDGQQLELRAVGMTTGEVEIHPRYVGAPASKIIKARTLSEHQALSYEVAKLENS